MALENRYLVDVIAKQPVAPPKAGCLLLLNGHNPSQQFDPSGNSRVFDRRKSNTSQM